MKHISKTLFERLWIVVLLTGLVGVLLPNQEGVCDDNEYNFFYGSINSQLGPNYAQEYYNLVKGNYRYGAKLAAYCVYAFQNGFVKGYQQGSVHRQIYNQGYYNYYRQQLNTTTQNEYNGVLSFIRGWIGIVQVAERMEMELALYAGWQIGFNRGYRENGSSVPQPSNPDFRFYWSPGKSVYPIPSDAGAFDELRHAR